MNNECSSSKLYNFFNDNQKPLKDKIEDIISFKKNILEEKKVAQEHIDYLYLLIIQDKIEQKIIYLTHDIYNIGRRNNAEIIIQDSSVSRYHATIIKEYNQEENIFFYKIFDGNLSGQFSTNGLIINEKKYKYKYLEHGDLIKFSKESKARYFVIDKHSNIRDIFVIINSEKKLEFPLEDYNKQTLASHCYNFSDLPTEKDQIINYITKVSSLAELSPYPIIEINLQGKLTYYNEVASLLFPDLVNNTMSHPILCNLLKADHKIYGNLFMREINFHDKTFEQYIHYLPKLKLIRSYLFDFTKRKLIEGKLKDSEAKYRAVIEQTSEGILLFNAENLSIIEANKSAIKILGYSLTELINKNITNIINSYDKKFKDNLDLLKLSKISFTQELKLNRNQNKILYIEINVSLITYQDKLVFCSLFRDISQRKKLEKKLKYHAYHDSLTGLYKRNFFINYLLKTLDNAKRKEILVAIIFLDVDYFKQINDNYGHDIGDLLLKQFSQRLQNCFRQSDCLARWGGDEFIALLPNIISEKHLIIFLERIIKAMSHPFTCNNFTITTSTSIGVAIYPKHGQDIDFLLKKADEALYITKHNGRNGYTIIDT